MASAAVGKDVVVGDVGDDDPLLSGLEELRKAFVPLSSVLASAHQKQERHHALRELQFLLLFFVTLLPFILLQSKTSEYFENKLMFEQLLRETPFAPRQALARSVNVSTTRGAPFNGTVDLPYLRGPALDTSTVVEPKIRFDDISGPDEFWSWMHQVVGLQILLPQFCRTSQALAPVDSFWVFNDSDFLRELQAEYELACVGAQLPRFVLLNGIRIRQVAVLPRISCSPFLEPVLPTELQVGGGGTGFEEDFINPMIDPGLCYPAYQQGEPAQSSLRWGRFDFSLFFPAPSPVFNSTYVYAWQQQSVMQSNVLASRALGPVTADGFPVFLPVVNSSFYSVVNRIFQYATSVVSRDADGRPWPADGLPFLGQPTRAISVTIPSYNPSNDQYSSVRAMFLVGPTGSWSKSLAFSNKQPVDAPVNAEDVSVIVFGALSVIYALAYIVRFVRHFNFFRHGHFFVVVELALVGCYIAAVYFIVTDFANIGLSTNALDDAADGTMGSLVDPLWVCPAPNGTSGGASGFAPCGGVPPFVGLDGLENRDTEQILYATTVLLVTLRLLALLIRFRRFRILYATISYARLNLAYYFIIYFVIYVGYFLSGYLYYSYDLAEFSSLGTSALTMLLWFGKANVAVTQLDEANAWSWVFGPLFFISYIFIFNWVFAAVLLAVIYNAFSAVKEAAFARETENDALEAELARLGMLYAQGAEANEAELVARLSRASNSAQLSLWRVVRKMWTSPEYRPTGRAVCCERVVGRSRPGWVSAVWVLINLKEWSRKNPGVFFVDFKQLREAIRGDSQRNPPAEQVQAFFEELKDEMLSKTEVDQRTAQIEIERRQSHQGELARADQLGPSLSMRKSLSRSVENVARDEDTWLLQVDRYANQLAVRQGKNSVDLGRLAETVARLAAETPA